MEVCDRVSTDSNGSQQAVQTLIKRLAHRNANVQLYTLEVSLSQTQAQLAQERGRINMRDAQLAKAHKTAQADF